MFTVKQVITTLTAEEVTFFSVRNLYAITLISFQPFPYVG